MTLPPNAESPPTAPESHPTSCPPRSRGAVAWFGVLAMAAAVAGGCTVVDDASRTETFREHECGAGRERGKATQTCEYTAMFGNVQVANAVCADDDTLECTYVADCTALAWVSTTCRSDAPTPVCPLPTLSTPVVSKSLTLPDGDRLCDPPAVDEILSQRCYAGRGNVYNELLAMCNSQPLPPPLQKQVTCCIDKQQCALDDVMCENFDEAGSSGDWGSSDAGASGDDGAAFVVDDEPVPEG